jgi:2-hydroxychromene-2-carboxylate isomerase
MLVLRMATLDFWYEFASTYSYLSVMRIEQEAERAGVALTWRPFLLGPIFKAQGWDTSPFNIYPAKGRYMARDVARLCAARGLPFRMPEPFPQNGLCAARLALIGAAEGWAADFTRAVFAAEFAEGAQIAERDVLARCLVAAGQNAEKQLIRIEDQGIKNLLKAQTTQAEALGIFGAPTFVTEDGELFWGDDRLEQALEWATRK